jgi:aspartate beta-hydroxylase
MPDGDDLRIRQLVEQAAQAFGAGRPLDAERLIRQAEAEAPQHPLVLNEVGKRLMSARDPQGAAEALETAARGEPGNAIIWLNLAIALRALDRPGDERAALDRALDIEPSNFHALMQAASLHEMQGEQRLAAATYRTALQLIPRGLPLHMRPALDKATACISANDRALEAHLDVHLEEIRARHLDQRLGRFDRALDTLLQKRKVYRPTPSFLYVPQLPAIEFYEREDFPWLDQIEAATADIRAELIDVLADGPTSLEPYVSVQGTPGDQWKELNNSRRWGVFYLWKAGTAMFENQARCPRTTAALSSWPKCDLAGTAPTATFSILDARTKIPPHVGVNNARLICHLPLIVPPGCGFRVGAETREWEPGRAFVFDDTIEHEAWNNSDEPRAVLIFDIWNPFISPAERELITALTVGVGEFYGELPGYIAGSPN